MTLTRSRRGAGLPARRVLRLSCAAACLLAGPVFPAAAQTEEKSIVLTDELMQSQSSPEAHARVVRWLREAIDPNGVQDGAGNTVMHYVATNTPEILATAIDRGGDCNRRNAHGASPLHFAAAQAPVFGPGPRSIRLLVECGADPDLRDRRGAAPLHAVYLGIERSGALPIRALNRTDGGLRVDVLQALLESGADPGVRDGNGDTPLMMAVKEFGADIELSPRRAHLRLLVEHGADPDARDKAGATPLILAVTLHARKRGDTAETIIGGLIGLGADPDLRDRAGDTALIRAAKIDERDSAAAIRALLAGGADPCLADRAGRLPYDHAAEGSAQRELLDKAGGGRDWETGLCVREIRATAEAEKKLGLGKEARSRIQSCLKGAGFDPGPADGAFGSRTRAALRGWQAKQGRKGAAAAGYLTKADAAALLACKSAPSPVCAGKAGAACWMEAANRPGCYLWNPHPKPEETVTWSGACVDGKASGKGEAAWRFREDGESKTSSSKGEYRDGRASDGHWIARFSNGETWEGPVAGGKPHGVWVRRGSGGRDRACRLNGERVDDSRCVGGDDRSMQAVRATAVGSGPGVDYESVGGIQAGGKVKVTGKAGDWLRVALPDGKAGFVPASALEEWKSPDPILTATDDGGIKGRNHTCEDFRYLVRDEIRSRCHPDIINDGAERYFFLEDKAKRPDLFPICNGIYVALHKTDDPQSTAAWDFYTASKGYFHKDFVPFAANGGRDIADTGTFVPNPGVSTFLDKCKADIKSCKPIEGVSEAEIDWKMIIDPEAIRKRGGPPYARWDYRCAKEDIELPLIVHEYRFDPDNAPKSFPASTPYLDALKVEEPPTRIAGRPALWSQFRGNNIYVYVGRAGSLAPNPIPSWASKPRKSVSYAVDATIPPLGNNCGRPLYEKHSYEEEEEKTRRGEIECRGQGKGFCAVQHTAFRKFMSQCRQVARRCKGGQVDWWFNWYPTPESSPKGRIGGGELACAK